MNLKICIMAKKIFLAIEQLEEENAPNQKQRISRYKFYQRADFLG